MVVHVYNPSHDEALAIDKAQYCPSSAARRTGEMFWDVAKHWAAPADVILHLPPDGSLRGVAAPDWTTAERIEPWGWDRHIVGVLRRLGAPDRLLPTEEQLDAIRRLSSRQTAVRVLEQVNDFLLHAAGGAEAAAAKGSLPNVLRAESRWCTTEAAALAAVAAFGHRAMLKQPWSCSGRGVWRSDSPSSANRLRKTLREQGAVEVEPLYDRVADFAMEFFAASDGSVGYEGLSLFATHAGGGYAGNVVASQAELAARLDALVAPASASAAGTPLPLDALSALLCRALAIVLAGAYTGPLGVDMMLTPAGIHPCIEVNLRNTMGRVAIFEHRRASST